MKKLFKIIVLLMPLAGLGVPGGNAYAAACTSAATGNWSNKNTWAAPCNVVGGPTAADTATILNTHNVTANSAIVAGAVTVDAGGTLTIAGGGASNFTVNGATSVSGTVVHTTAGGTETYVGLLTINAGGAWTNGINGSVTLQGGLANNGTFTAGTGIYTFNTTAAQSVNSATALTIPNVTVTAPTVLTNNSDLTVSTALAGTGSLTNGATGTLNIAGTCAITTLNASAVGNTVNYTGAAQTVKLPSGAPATYYSLGLGGSGIKTMPATAMTVAGDFTMSGTATTTAAQALTVDGNFTVGATNTFAAGAFAHSIAGNWSNNGTFTASTSTVTFNGTVAQTIGGAAATTFNNLTVANTAAGSTTLLQNTAVTGNLSVNSGTLDLGAFTANRTAPGGTITVANGATLMIGGTNGFPANYTTATLGATSTVIYGGASQTVAATAAPGYGNLTLSGSGTKTMPAAAQTVTGNFTMAGTASATAGGALTIGGGFVLGSGTAFDAGAFSHSIAGNFTNDGVTFTASTSTITLDGVAAQVIGGTSATTFNNLVISNASGVTLGNNQTVNGTLTLTNGKITPGTNTLDVTSSCATGISGGGAASYVLGSLSLRYPTGAGTTSCTFPIGDATAYTPATVTLANVTSALANSVLTARTDAGDHADTTAGASGITAARSVNRFWTLTPGASLAFATYNATFTFVAGDIDGGANTASFIIGHKNGASWYYPAMGAKNPTNTTATGITQASGFGEFVIGERVMPSITILKTVAVYSDPVNLLVNPKFIPGAAAQYTVIASNSGGPADDSLTSIIDPIPANTVLYVNDIGGAGSGPVLFAQGASSSTLTYTRATDLSFSNDGGTTWAAVPVADALGCDATVPPITHIRVNPKGSFAGSAVAPNPSFQLTFRVCVK